MPRTRKTMSGAPAQTIRSVPGQRYGEGVEQQALQQAMPAPDLAGAPSPSPSSGAPAGAPVMPPSPNGPDPAAVAQFLASTRPNLLAGTQLPGQPVTEGLSLGPGRGPEALMNRAQTPIARYMRQLSEDTGNPKWRRLAERAGL